MSTLHRIANDHLAVEVSSLGAEMQSLSTGDGRSWLWNGDARYWAGRSPILFPTVGRSPGDKVIIGEQNYDMAQHGFARRSEFETVEATATRCRHELAASARTEVAYPFDFQLVVEHSLEGPALTVTAEVVNRDASEMVFGIGFHPAFVWPLPGAAGRPHVVELENRGEPGMRRVENGLMLEEIFPSPFREGRLVLDHSLFDQDAMIFPEGAGTALSYGAEEGPTIRFNWTNLPNLALWSKPGAPFLCIEPWHGTAPEIGASARLDERPYTVSLAPGASATFGFTVDLAGIA